MRFKVLWKTAAAIGSGTPDEVKSEAAALPAAPVAVENKPAPGQTGPRGLAPRTTYSRVNTGQLQTPDIASQAKNAPPRGTESLLPKTANVPPIDRFNSMSKKIASSVATRPLLQDLVKTAMEGVVSRVDITNEAARQLGYSVEDEEKTASENVPEYEHIPTEMCEKYASALEYLAKQAAEVGAGEGPGALEVSQSDPKGENIDASGGGQATAPHVPPMDPPTMATEEQSSDPANAMESNDASMPEAQPENPMHNESASIAPQKNASAKLAAKNLSVLAKLANAKEASALFSKNLVALGLSKQAEDALNPAQISAGQASAQGEEAPEGASAAGEGPAPAVPSDVKAQEKLIATNEAAINYTKEDAKEDPKKDLGHILEEPALSADTDKTLDKILEHSEGAKISSARVKAAAAKALSLKFAEAAKAVKAAKCKSKQSQLDTASGQSGFTASSMNPGSM